MDKLELLLQNFDVPFYRLHLNKNNLIWLQKNLKKKNSMNKNFNQVQQLIEQYLKERLYKS